MGHISDVAPAGPDPAPGSELVGDGPRTQSPALVATGASQHSPRKDIQALRALAVAMVVVYHFWPRVLPGGFVGVDVFFVISGFLITGALVDAPARPGRPDRVLGAPGAPAAARGDAHPAGLTGSHRWFLPPIEWQPGARHAWTSMLYVENWRLARTRPTTCAPSTASPFQHFWSLSVEEQFYIGWPLLIGLVAVVATRRGWPMRTALASAIGAATVASFAYSLSLSWSDPSLAYFSTLARVWELGLGGLLAVWSTRGKRAVGTIPGASLVAWAAVAGMVAAGLVLDKTSVFPGWNALLPTVCAALFILAGDPQGPLSPRRLTHARGVQLVGDTSYAIYLWHWPALLLVPLCLDLEPSTWLKVLLLPAVLLLAWLSTTYVEDRLRAAPRAPGVRRRGAVVLVLCSGLVVGLCVLMTWWVDRAAADSERQLAALSSAVVEPTCIGAGANDPDLDCPPTRDLVTTPEFSSGDIPPSIKVGECLNWPPFAAEPITCALGSEQEPARRIALYGNSHAGHWQPALDAIATARGWQVDTYVVGVCQPTLDNGAMPGVWETEADNCDALQEKVQSEITSRDYDLVVMSTMDHESPDPEVYQDTLTRLRKADVPVLVIRDTPAPFDPDNPPRSVSAATWMTSTPARAHPPRGSGRTRCTWRRRTWTIPGCAPWTSTTFCAPRTSARRSSAA